MCKEKREEDRGQIPEEPRTGSACVEVLTLCMFLFPPSTYSGKVFQVTVLSLGGFLLLPLLVIILILESPIQPEVFR